MQTTNQPSTPKAPSNTPKAPSNTTGAVGSAPVSKLGQGFDTFNGQAVAAPPLVTGTQTTNNTSTDIQYQICTSVESLYSALNISAALAGSYTGVVDVNANAKVRWAQSIDFTSNSASLVAYGLKTSETSLASTFTPPTSSPQPSSGNGFREIYGDACVTSWTTGVEFYAVYTFTATSETTQQSLAASLSVAVSQASWNANLDLAVAMESVASSTNTTYSYTTHLAGTQAAPPEESMVLQWLFNTFPGIAEQGNNIVSFLTTGYENLPGWPSNAEWGQIPQNRMNLASVAQSYTVLSGLNNAVQLAQKVLQTYGQTQLAQDPLLGQQLSQVPKDVSLAQNYLALLEGDPTQSYPMPTFASLSFTGGNTQPGAPATPVPVLNYTLNSSWPLLCGGNGGVSFQDVNAGSVMACTTLSAIAATGSNGQLAGLQVTYNSSSGPNVVTRGNQSSSFPPATSITGPAVTKVLGLGYGADTIQQIQIWVSGNATPVYTWTSMRDNHITVPMFMMPPAPGVPVFLGFWGYSNQSEVSGVGCVSVQFSAVTWSAL